MKGSGINLNDYQEIPKEAVLASKYLARLWAALGKPETPFTPSGQKLMEKIIKVWEICYPVDYDTFMAERRNYQDAEMRISEQVAKRTGRSLASYPFPVYQMMRKLFIGFDAAERRNCIRMVKLWPQFRMANRI